MSKPIRILQYGLSDSLAGVEKVIMDLYRNIDRDRIQFDFLMMNDQIPYFADEIENMGGRIYNAIYLRGKNPIKGTFWNYDFFRKHREFAGIHCNVSSIIGINRILTPYVQKHIPKRIIHVHNTGDGAECTKKHIAKVEYVRAKLNKYATDLIACSHYAGVYNYGEGIEFETVLNAISLEHYRFDFEARNKIRKKYGLENRLVIGNVAKMRYQKNHDFLIDVFFEIRKRAANAVLMLIGVGPLETEIRKKIEMLGIQDSVLFLGEKKDVEKYYSAMDLFVLPSRYEGLGLVFLEAQTSGLSCFTSTGTPQEVDMTNNTHFLGLDKAPAAWAEEILQARVFNEIERKAIFNTMVDKKCDVLDYAKQFEGIYLR